MARQLQARGEEVQFLALLDTKAPNAEAETEVIDDASLLASFALHLGLSPGQIHDVADAISEAQPEDYLSFMLERAKAANIIPHDMSLAHLRQQFRVFNANIHAARSYRPANHPASMSLFRAEERPSDTHADTTLGWSQLGVENIEVYDTPGNHLTIMREPYVSVLAERLAACIKHAQSV
jgi:thioesterase domain-containing protein